MAPQPVNNSLRQDPDPTNPKSLTPSYLFDWSPIPPEIN
ncbi:hypothetical protein K3495_g10747 [Podosphaera aphanis]|nr:hypothetical protein K3495_g10747 [Podosphaera aphanis]